MTVRGSVIIETTIEAMTCPTCGVLYGLSSVYREQRQQDGAGWACPNGHSIVYRESEAEKAKQEAATARQEARQLREQCTRLENDLLDQVKERKRIEKRIHAGVCPFCKRTFANVQRHMESKHGT